MLAANPLIQVTPGLMIWTIVCFLVVLFVLKRYAFGPIQQMIDTRRERIEQAIAEADNAREEARKPARGAPQADRPGEVASRRRSSPRHGASPTRSATGSAQETEEDRQRRLEETRRQIEQATAQALGADPRRGREALAARGREDHAQVAHRTPTSSG